MIELFRHEAMNQATVIAGFCEIIENLLIKQPQQINDEFLNVLHKTEQLILSFTRTLAVFREESMVYNPQNSNEIPQSIDEIMLLLSPSCKIHFGVLREIAVGLSTIVDSIRREDIGNSIIANRYLFVKEAAFKLYALFTDPAALIQKDSDEELRLKD